MIKDPNRICPLCHSTSNFTALTGPDGDHYSLCHTCRLIFADREQLPTMNDEKHRYLLHNNSIEEEGYVKFLHSIIDPVLPHLKPGTQGLDYGCGPNPVLATLVQNKGFKCDYYDPLFFPEINIDISYDFIFATECFEHFFSPAAELKKLTKLLKPGGLLAVMTEIWQDVEQFGKWYYIRDNTHVSFYSMQTIEYICEEYGFKIIYTDNKRRCVLEKI